MILILLAVLGVPLWLVVGALGAGLWSRRSFRKVNGVVAVKCRPVDTSTATPAWPRRVVYARWVHDVLIVHQGAALVRNRALPVAALSPSTVRSAEVRGLGDEPTGVLLRLDGGEQVEVAAASSDRDGLSGPFAEPATTVEGRDELPRPFRRGHPGAGGDRSGPSVNTAE